MNRLDRLRHLVDARFSGKASRLASAVGRSASMVNQWLSGHRAIGDGSARTIEQGLQLPQGWMDWGACVDPQTPDPVQANDEEGLVRAPIAAASPGPVPEHYIRLPVLARAAAGFGQEVSTEHIAQMDVFAPWFQSTYGRSPANVSLLTAKGASMAGVVEDGDVMFVAPVTEFRDDGIYIISIGGLLRVKRLRLRIDGMLSIESTDGSQPELLPLDQVGELLHVQGQVIGSLGVRKHA